MRNLLLAVVLITLAGPVQSEEKTMAQQAGYMLTFVDIPGENVGPYRAEYGANAFPLVLKHGGILIAGSADGVVKEGTFPSTRWFALLEFPSVEAAGNFYNDSDYQPLIPVRQQYGVTTLGIVAGLTEGYGRQDADVVYMVAFVDTSDIERYEREYVQFGLPLIEKHGGRVIVAADTAAVKEGTYPPGRIAIAEFPSMDAAEAFYTDPDYQPLIKVRQSIGATVLGFFQKGTAPR